MANISDNKIIMMDFTGAYEYESFYRHHKFAWVDLTDLSGSDCFCSPEAEQTIINRIKDFSVRSIHFIDSGNHHYVSKFWTDKIKTPFSLILFDHHPDMQPPLFESVLTCGSWVKELLDKNRYLQKVVLIGIADKLADAIPDSYKDRVICYSESTLDHGQIWKELTRQHINEPVYISIDKDVLSTEVAVTDWDQGSMNLEELESLLKIIIRNHTILGMDICGECSNTLKLITESRIDDINDSTNECIVQFLLSFCKLK
jgi:arginase family enzyme